MRKLRTVLSATATAAMVLGTMGAASAQGSTPWEARADFIYQLDKQLGIQPVYPANPDFQDVSTTSPYYGYIEAAYQDGITNGFSSGIFGPTLALTRAEAAKYLVIAFGAGSEAQNVTSTSFSDNGDIPTALVGYVGEAAALGLLKGFPGGTFEPNSNLTTVQEGYLLDHLKAAMGTLSLKVTPSATDVAPGQIVTLATTGTSPSGANVPAPIVTYSVTGTNAADALLSGSSFVASAAGNYTVQANAGSATATATIGVYGAAAALKVNAPTSIVANGVSQTSVTVDVVDANGNIVGNNSDPIGLGSSAASVASVVASPETAVNGVATFTLQSGTVAGSVATLSAGDLAMTGSATVATTAQVPTSLTVSAAQMYLDANATGYADQISAVVEDQTGNPMLTGAYPVTFAVTGPATLSGTTGIYYGPSKAAANVNALDVQGSTGAVTVTASASGVTSGSANLTSVIAGAPAQIALSAAQTEKAGTAATYTATIEDSHGYPINWSGQLNLKDSDTGLSASLLPASLTFANQASKTFQAADTLAGSYTLTASDNAAALTSATTTLAVTSGALAKFALTPAGGPLMVSLSSPTYPVSVQLEDTNGNPVAEAGVQVSFMIAPAGPHTGSATLTTASGSTTSAGGTALAYTGASGVATATVTAQAYSGDAYRVTATATGAGSQSSAVMVLTQSAATSPIALSLQNSSSTTVTSLVSGNDYTAKFQLKDGLGNNVTSNDLYQVTLGGTGTAEINGTLYSAPVQLSASAGLGQFTITPQLAGTLTVTVQDMSVYGAPASTTSYAVSPGSTVSSVGFSAGGASVTTLTVAAGGNAAVTVSAADAGGNPIVAASTLPVDLTSSATGAFRLSPSGADLKTQTVDIPAGQSSITVYYVNTTGATESVSFGGTIDYVITAPASVTIANNSQASLKWTVADAAGHALAGVAVTFSATGTVSAAGVTNALGQVTATYTSPASGTSTDTVQMSVQGVNGVAPSSVTVKY